MGEARIMKRKLLTALLTFIFTFGTVNAFAVNSVQPGVYIVPGSKINLVSSQSRFPIQVRNDYDTDVRVLVWVKPTVLWLTTPEIVEVKVPANTTVNAKVPVTAVSNGNAVVRVRLTSFSGVRIGRVEYMHFHVERDMEPAIVIGFFVVVVALGAVGTQRMLRRRRGAAE